MIANVTSLETETYEEAVSELSFPASSSNRLTPGEVERNELIERYYHLVDRVVAKLRRKLPPHFNVDDLQSAGVTGLVAAAERFTAAQSATFEGYACLRIRGAILDELRRIDPCSRRSRLRARQIQTATQEITQLVGRRPTDAEVSGRLQISSGELERWRESAAPVRIVSLDFDAESDTANSASLHEVIADENQECVRETTEKQDLLKFLTERIHELPDMQKKILAFYYFEDMRFAEIAEVFGFTESRVCQIHKQAIAKLRALIRAERE